jgi:hypothetical protein
MKTFIKIFPLVLMLALGTSAFAKDSVNVIQTRHETQFVFKVNRTLLGARVEVLTEDGKQLNVQRLMKRKMIIDFADLPVGRYTIVIEKDGKSENFEYVRNWR